MALFLIVIKIIKTYHTINSFNFIKIIFFYDKTNVSINFIVTWGQQITYISICIF